MKPSSFAASSRTPIKLLSKHDRTQKRDQSQDDDESDKRSSSDQKGVTSRNVINVDAFLLKPGREARKFKLIDEREWNIISAEPPSETVYYTEGHSALSIVSVVGHVGVGKSSLLNVLAGKEIFDTHNSQHTGDTMAGKHLTKGIDIYSTYHRILLDCQPFLASSILEDFLIDRSKSQFKSGSSISEPMTSCHMISIQLATFLIATSDHVIIVLRWLADVHLLKLLASAIMLIGEDNIRAKFIVFSSDEQVHDARFRKMLDVCLGLNRVDRVISDGAQLYTSVAQYSREKLDLYQKDPSTFTGKNWLATCQRLWNSTIKGSSMFTDYAYQVYDSINNT